MGVLHIRDENGDFKSIIAINGKSAYEQAKDGGYQGTEEEFIQLLGSLGNGYGTQPTDVDGAFEQHIANKSNPHGVTASQTGAIPANYSVSTDLNTELQQGGNKMSVCSYNSTTLNTPYKEGVTVFAHGMVITNAHNTEYAVQICLPSGDSAIYIRRLNKQGVSAWAVLSPEKILEYKAIADSNKTAIENLTTAMTQKLSVASGQYTGTGTFGEANKNTLTFPFVPKVVFISTPSKVAAGTDYATYFAPATLVNGTYIGFITQSTEDATRSYSIPINLSWSDKTLSWYYVNTSTTSSGMTAANQLNYSGMVYSWVAIG